MKSKLILTVTLMSISFNAFVHADATKLNSLDLNFLRSKIENTRNLNILVEVYKQITKYINKLDSLARGKDLAAQINRDINARFSKIDDLRAIRNLIQDKINRTADAAFKKQLSSTISRVKKKDQDKINRAADAAFKKQLSSTISRVKKQQVVKAQHCAAVAAFENEGGGFIKGAINNPISALTVSTVKPEVLVVSEIIPAQSSVKINYGPVMTTEVFCKEGGSSLVVSSTGSSLRKTAPYTAVPGFEKDLFSTISCLKKSEVKAQHLPAVAAFGNEGGSSLVASSTGSSLRKIAPWIINPKKALFAMGTLGTAGGIYAYNSTNKNIVNPAEVSNDQRPQQPVKSLYDQTKSFIFDHKVATGASVAAVAALGVAAYKYGHKLFGKAPVVQVPPVVVEVAQEVEVTPAVKAAMAATANKQQGFKSNYNKNRKKNASRRR